MEAQRKWAENYNLSDETREFSKLIFGSSADEVERECIELLEAGANPNITGGYTETAFTSADEVGTTHLVRCMVDALRAGRAREKPVAKKELKKRLRKYGQNAESEPGDH